MIEGRGVQRMIPSTVNHIRHGQPWLSADSWEVDNKTKRRPAPALLASDWQPCHQSRLYLEMCNNV